MKRVLSTATPPDAPGQVASGQVTPDRVTVAPAPSTARAIAGAAVLAIGEFALAAAVFLLVTAIRVDVLAGDWSANYSPIAIAAGVAALWIAALAVVGAYAWRVRQSARAEAVRVTVAALVLLALLVGVLLVLNVAGVSRILLGMLVVALPVATLAERRVWRVIGSLRSPDELAEPGPGLGIGGRPITVIQPPKAWPGLGLTEFWRLRSICLVLTRRNLMVRYRQTIVGAAWSLIQPLLLMIVFTIFFGFLGRGETLGLPFPVFYLLGLIPYQMVSKIIAEGTGSVVGNSPLVTRVYFPRAYFPTSVALAALSDFGLALIPTAGLLLYFGITISPNIIFAPFFVVVAWFAGLGLTYLLSALNVVFRDIAQLVPFFTQVLVFLSPVIYTSAIIPEPYRALYFLNPLALVVEGFRWSIAGSPPPPLYAFVIGPTVTVLLVVVGYVAFRKREPLFADYV
jgi:lipopolysaccharide transport system permease protein